MSVQRVGGGSEWKGLMHSSIRSGSRSLIASNIHHNVCVETLRHLGDFIRARAGHHDFVSETFNRLPDPVIVAGDEYVNKAFCDFLARSYTCWVMGFPTMSLSAFSPTRVDLYLAGMIPYMRIAMTSAGP